MPMPRPLGYKKNLSRMVGYNNFIPNAFIIPKLLALVTILE